jgi:hypothetical protein
MNWIAKVLAGVVAVVAVAYGCSRNAPSIAGSRCASDWQTITELGRQYTLASTNSDHEIKSGGCAQMIFTCDQGEPIFEIRLPPNAPPFKSASALATDGPSKHSILIGKEHFVDSRSIKVAVRTDVEMIAQMLVGAFWSTIEISFSDENVESVQFSLGTILDGLRPVMFACKMRRLRQENEQADGDRHDDYQP